MKTTTKQSGAEQDLKSMPMSELQTTLGTSPDGLSQAEAQKRLTQYGPNEIEEKKTNSFLKFLTYFWGPIPWMIEAAVILSAVARHWPDFAIILLLLVANAVVGFWEEHQAGNAIEALKAKLAIKARVKRDGQWISPAARELVPGDIIRVRLGDIVPADARLLARKGAIVTRLAAIEELAGVDVLCADKAGTLTQNKLTLGDPFSVNDIPAEQVILLGALASRAENNDTIDLAILESLKNKEALQGYQVVHLQPFDPVHKRTEVAVKAADGKAFKVTKGAPQVILELSANAGQVKPAVGKAVNEFAARGFRSLGVARAEADGQWEFLGVLPLFDPPRDDARATIA
jgi:magnesium-transporting ATPase (P-type)